MYLSLISIPLLGSITSGFFGRKLGQSGSELITIICVLLSTIFSIFTFFEVGFNNSAVSLKYFSWIQSEAIDVSWSFNFDSLTVSMLIPVLIVSLLVHVYSVGYMSHDPHVQRFFSYLSLFTFMMIILVTANNFLLMFVGWEGVGICSYLLVNFWFTRIAANQSSISALLTNRVGDCFLTIGMFVILFTFGNLDYSTVFSLSPYINNTIITIIGVCILIGAMAKSSQVGLHVWLPMAMEGPTPVSALIHAATMVTAGVYLLMRSSPIIEYSSLVLVLCLWVGGITNVFSSLIGLFQQDIKKVIAYSTMSQLGMMVIAIGLSSYTIALFHLVNHAFYKALLFLAAGSVIHAVGDNQDFRKYGGLKPFLPLTYSVMLVASLSLVAFPFMTGFYSKDFILESSFGQYNYSSIVIYSVATIGAMFTTLYSAKVLYLTFLAKPTGSEYSYKNAHEGDIFMSSPLIILAFFSIFFGFVTKDIFIGLGSGFFSDNGIFIHPSHEIMLDTEFGVPVLFKLLPLIFTVLLSMLSIIVLEVYPKLIIKGIFTKVGHSIYSFFSQRFYIELFYNNFITEPVLKLGGQTTKVLDKGVVEFLGPYGLQIALTDLSNNIGNISRGALTTYNLLIFAGLVSYLILPFMPSILWTVILFGLFSKFSNKGHKPVYQDNMQLIKSSLIPNNIREYLIRFNYKFIEKHKSVKSFIIKTAIIAFTAIIIKYTLSVLFDPDTILGFTSINGTAVSVAFIIRSVYETITDLNLINQKVTFNLDNKLSNKTDKLAHIGNTNSKTPLVSVVEEEKLVHMMENEQESTDNGNNATDNDNNTTDNNQETADSNNDVVIGEKRPASEELTPPKSRKSPKLDDDNTSEVPSENPEESDSSSKGGFDITFDESDDNNEPNKNTSNIPVEDTSNFAPDFLNWQKEDASKFKKNTELTSDENPEDTSATQDTEQITNPENTKTSTAAPLAFGHTLGIIEPQIRRTGSPLGSDVQSSSNTQGHSSVQITKRLGIYPDRVDVIHIKSLEEFLSKVRPHTTDRVKISDSVTLAVPVRAISDFLDTRPKQPLIGFQSDGSFRNTELGTHRMWGGTINLNEYVRGGEKVIIIEDIIVRPRVHEQIIFKLGGEGTNENVGQSLSFLLYHVREHGVFMLTKENTDLATLTFVKKFLESRGINIPGDEIFINNSLINGLFSA